jgi:hypothetical protein
MRAVPIIMTDLSISTFDIVIRKEGACNGGSESIYSAPIRRHDCARNFDSRLRFKPATNHQQSILACFSAESSAGELRGPTTIDRTVGGR